MKASAHVCLKISGQLKTGRPFTLLTPAVTCRYLVRLVSRTREGICVTSYEQLRRQRAHLINVSWGYVVLDEGHKIRNPDAEVTLAAKQLATVGSPSLAVSQKGCLCMLAYLLLCSLCAELHLTIRRPNGCKYDPCHMLSRCTASS